MILRLTLNSLRSHARRLISTSLAVCLGVAFLSGTMVLGDTLQASFDDLFESALGGTDVVVRRTSPLDGDSQAASGLIDTDLSAELIPLPEVEQVAPEIRGFGQIVGSDGEKLGGFGPPTFAGNWITTDELNSYELVAGRPPEGLHEVVINRGAAEDGVLRIGDTTTVATPEPVDATIVGIAAFAGQDGLGPTTFAAFSLAGAETHITGREGVATALLIEAAPGVSQQEAAAAVRSVLPDGLEAMTGSALVQENLDSIESDFLGFFQTFLLVFAGIALLVATFSIYNTFSIIVAQRQRESALLRAIGADRRQILAATLLETLALGLIASAVGLVVGFGLAAGLDQLFHAAGFPLPSGPLVISAATLITAPVVGLLVTVVAGVGPAIRSSRVAPLAALRDVAIDHTGTSRIRAVIGAAITAIGAAVVIQSVASGSETALGPAALGAVATIAGVVTLGPVVARPAASAIGALLPRLRGVAGRLARNNAVRSPRRTAGTASALMIGVGVVVIFAVIAGSLKASLNSTVSDVLEADLVYAGSQFGGGGLSPGLAESIAALDETSTAAGLASGPVGIAGETEMATAVDPVAMTDLLDPDVTAGNLGALTAGAIAVSEPVAAEHGWQVGSDVAVRFGDGATESLQVAATFEPSPLIGDYVVPRATWTAHAVQTVDRLVLVAVAPGVALGAARETIEHAAAPFAPPDLQSRAEYVESVSARVDGMLTLIYAMLALAVIIALMGIANTLSLAIHERTRELGLLRAVGATRRQVRSMIRWESVIIALFGTVGGVALGTFLAWGLVAVATAASGSPVVTFDIPVGQVAVIVASGALAGVLAAIRPARRAARLDTLDAIAVQ